MGFHCECGFAWKGTLPETRQDQGDYLTLIEQEEWMEEASEAITSFVEASASGLRDQWFDGSKYFNSVYPRDLPDREVIRDLLFATQRSRGVEVFRCPRCRRVYIEEQTGTNRWLTYQFVERNGNP